MRNWKALYKEIIEKYNSGKSPADIAIDYDCSRTTIKNIIAAKQGLRSQSESSKLAVSQGKKIKAIKNLIEVAKTTNRFNPLKCPGKGEKHPQWIKDRTKLKFPRSRTELREWRTKVFERDNYTCQLCQQRGGKLNADHINAYSMFPELREDINNGRTLCEKCHKKTPNYGRKATLITNKINHDALSQ